MKNIKSIALAGKGKSLNKFITKIRLIKQRNNFYNFFLFCTPLKIYLYIYSKFFREQAARK